MMAVGECLQEDPYTRMPVGQCLSPILVDHESNSSITKCISLTSKCMHGTVEILVVFVAFRAIIPKSTPKAFKFVRLYKGCATNFFDERGKLFPPRNTKGVQRRESHARNSVNTNGFRCAFPLYSPKASRKSSDSTGFIRVAQLNASMNGNAVSPKEY